MNGQDVGTAEQFSQQAADLAQVGVDSEPTDLNWFPLGVFAMVRNEQQHPHLIMQLAINRQGMFPATIKTKFPRPRSRSKEQSIKTLSGRPGSWVIINHWSWKPA